MSFNSTVGKAESGGCCGVVTISFCFVQAANAPITAKNHRYLYCIFFILVGRNLSVGSSVNAVYFFTVKDLKGRAIRMQSQ